MSRRAVGLAGAIALDLGFGEPPNGLHPVVGIGRALAVGYDRFRRSRAIVQFAGGAASLGGVAVAVAVVGRTLERRLPALLCALVLKPTFSLRPLIREALGVAEALESHDLPAARHRLGALVSRPTDGLDTPLLAAAAIESVAENLSDSVVAPWLYYAGLGLAGSGVYRVINTADAMYGYRGEFEWLGKAAARTDDAVNWLPSRATALSLVMAARLTQGGAAGTRALKCWRSDGARTASPNAGAPMAAMAGALGCRLEKVGHYVLGGSFPVPGAADIRRATRLAETAAALTAAAVASALVAAR
ncbi:MAG: adenosylcobinamide-phosphate synthase CbiB [Candidatus Dormibacteria bacterium]